MEDCIDDDVIKLSVLELATPSPIAFNSKSRIRVAEIARPEDLC